MTKFDIDFKGETYPVSYIQNEKLAFGAIDYLLDIDSLMGIDIETMPLPEFDDHSSGGLSPNLSQIRLLQICTGDRIFIFDLMFIPNHKIFIPLLETKRFVAHYAIFELQFFKKLGVKKMDLGCSLLATKLLYQAVFPTDLGRSLSLENVCKAVLKVELTKDEQKSKWSEPTLTESQLVYAAKDAIATLQLAEKIAVGLKKYNLFRVYKLCKTVQHAIADMQLNGIAIDTELHGKLLKGWEKEVKDSKKSLCESMELEDITDHKVSNWLLKTLSPEITNSWPKTSTGKLSTAAETMSDYEFLDIVSPFATYKKKSKLVSTYGQGLIDHINPVTQRIHANFTISGARTGRFSSSGPNMQNFPTENTCENFRSLFIPAKGNILIGADYNQIELRVAAELSRDPEMLRAYREGIDLHGLTASKLAGKPLELITKQERQLAKAVNFGLLFGLGAAKFSDYSRRSYKVEVTQKEAERAIQIFRTTYAGYRRWQLKQAEDAEGSLLSYTPCGKVRRLDASNYYGASLNTPVQGGAAEVMMYALCFMAEELPQYGGKLLATVHDEVLIEAPDEYSKEVLALVKDCMTRGFVEVFPTGITTGLIEAKVGYSWSEVH